MRLIGFVGGFGLLVLLQATASSAQDAPPRIVQGILTEPGSSPLHLSAVITETADINEHIDLDLYWASPTKWKRTITSQDFSQHSS